MPDKSFTIPRTEERRKQFSPWESGARHSVPSVQLRGNSPSVYTSTLTQYLCDLLPEPVEQLDVLHRSNYKTYFFPPTKTYIFIALALLFSLCSYWLKRELNNQYLHVSTYVWQWMGYLYQSSASCHMSLRAWYSHILNYIMKQDGYPMNLFCVQKLLMSSLYSIWCWTYSVR